MRHVGDRCAVMQLGLSEEEVAASTALQVSLDMEPPLSATATHPGASTSPPQGASYAQLTRLGLAALGPALGGGAAPQLGTSPPASGAWGNAPSAALRTPPPAPKAQATQQADPRSQWVSLGRPPPAAAAAAQPKGVWGAPRAAASPAAATGGSAPVDVPIPQGKAGKRSKRGTKVTL